MHKKLAWMKGHVYSVKAKSQAGKIRVKDIMSPRESNILGPRESAARVEHKCMRIHLKSCPTFPLNVTTTFLNGSRKGAVGLCQ